MKHKTITFDAIEEALVEIDIDWLKGAYPTIDPETKQLVIFTNLKEDDDGNLEDIVEEEDDYDYDDDDEDDDDEDDEEN